MPALIYATMFALLLSGCVTAPPALPEIDSAQPYGQAFQVVKNYLVKCAPGANLHANLYTDIPEGEIILNNLPSGSLIIVGTSVTSSTEFAREVISIHFKGVDKQTKISVKNDRSQQVVLAALAKRDCPAEP